MTSTEFIKFFMYCQWFSNVEDKVNRIRPLSEIWGVLWPEINVLNVFKEDFENLKNVLIHLTNIHWAHCVKKSYKILFITLKTNVYFSPYKTLNILYAKQINEGKTWKYKSTCKYIIWIKRLLTSDGCLHCFFGGLLSKMLSLEQIVGLKKFKSLYLSKLYNIQILGLHLTLQGILLQGMTHIGC